MTRALRGLGLGIACLILTAASTFAQLSTAQLSGKVTDQPDKVVQGAGVPYVLSAGTAMLTARR